MDNISPDKLNEIRSLLESLETEYDISIIHAVESGSRAWGFASADSDYDIRFIYHHKPSWYITAFDKKDHIDMAIDGDLDTGGWDIGKALRLLYKGNAVVHEWLRSPLVYHSLPQKHDALKQFANQAFNPAAAFYHYFSQVKKRLTEDKTRSNAKAFLYGYRSLLCARWIAENASAPPVIFQVLVEKYLNTPQLTALQSVLEQKSLGKEQDPYTVPTELWQHCVENYEELKAMGITAKRISDYQQYDKVLHDVLADCY